MLALTLALTLTLTLTLHKRGPTGSLFRVSQSAMLARLNGWKHYLRS